MSANVLTRIVFIVWIVTVAALSVMPHTKGDGLISAKLTKSGFVMHVMAYFMGMLLCYWAYTKKDEGHRAPQLNPLRGAPLGAPALNSPSGFNRVKIQRGREIGGKVYSISSISLRASTTSFIRCGGIVPIN